MTIGSGGSGGVFGPSMVIGGCGGGALGILLHRLWPGAGARIPASFVIVGMAGFFAAAAKTPFSTLVIVSEMTGDYNLLLPALWVCTLAFLLSDEQSIYSRRSRAGRARRPTRGAMSATCWPGCGSASSSRPGTGPVIHAGDPLAVVTGHFQDPSMPVLPVVDDAGRLLGVVSPEEVNVAPQSPAVSPLLVAADLTRGDVTPLRPDDDWTGRWSYSSKTTCSRSRWRTATGKWSASCGGPTSSANT